MNGIEAEICRDCGGLGRFGDCDDCGGTGKHQCDCGHTHACGSCNGKQTQDCVNCYGTGNASAYHIIRANSWGQLSASQRSVIHGIMPFCNQGYPAIDDGEIVVQGRFDQAAIGCLQSIGFIALAHSFTLKLKSIAKEDMETLRREVAELITGGKKPKKSHLRAL